jgi:hypothetical protein
MGGSPPGHEDGGIGRATIIGEHGGDVKRVVEKFSAWMGLVAQWR